MTALVSVNHAGGGDCRIHVRFVRVECHRDDSQSRGQFVPIRSTVGAHPVDVIGIAEAENCEIRMTIYNLLHVFSCCLHKATVCFHRKHRGSIRRHRGSVRKVDLDGIGRIA